MHEINVCKESSSSHKVSRGNGYQSACIAKFALQTIDFLSVLSFLIG